MPSIRAPFPAFLTLLASFALAGCGAAPEESSSAALTIRGSAGSPPEVSAGNKPLGIPPGALTGNPASISIDLHGLYLGASPDCTDLVLAEDFGTTPKTVDLAEGSVLFSADPPSGSYACVVLRISDVLRIRPAASFGSCVGGSLYTGDIYRDGQSGWMDVGGLYTTGQGTDEAPVADPVALVLTTDPHAAVATGWDVHQVVQLGAALVVPGTSTFYWNGDGTIVSAGGQCGVYPGHPEFQ